MRVEGQGMATDYFPAKGEALSKPALEQKIFDEQMTLDEKRTKVGLDAVNTGKKAKLEEVKGAIDEVNQAMTLSNYHLEFKLFKDSDIYQVKVVDSQSDEVIRKIPADYMIELARNIRETIHNAVGILVNELV